MPVLVGLLLSVYVLAAATSVAGKSITFDELGHLTGGFSAWISGDYRLFPQNGPLPQRWAALPLVALGYRFPSLDQSAWRSSNLEGLGYQFLYGIGNDHQALLWSSRLVMLPIGVVLGAVCYLWASRLFGVTGGIVALSAFVFSPSMLAHGPLATSDMMAALLFTSSVALFWRALHRCTPITLLASGLTMGLLFVTKMSAVAIVPVTLILIVLRAYNARPFVWSGAPRTIVSGSLQLWLASIAIFVAHLVLALIVIWAFYGFRYRTFQEDAAGSNHRFLGETLDAMADGAVARPLILRARDLQIVPEGYLFGFAHVLDRSGKFIGFLNGRYRRGGWWSFFPYTWLVKTPFALFALLALAGAYGWRVSRATAGLRRRRWRAAYRLIPLLAFVAVYWATAISSDLNLGERHLLPSYPALFILAGAAGGWLRRRQKVATVAVASALLLLSVESLATWPHYLAYFNLLAGGPAQGYRHLVDSSLDWGQDLPALQRWLQSERHRGGVQTPIYLSYFGSGNPATYGIDAQQIYSFQDWRSEPTLHELRGGIYCFSATMVQSLYTRAPGPWAVPYEEAYQRLRARVNRWQATGSDPSADSAARLEEIADWRRVVSDFDQLRVARLAAYLRHREPDAQVGYSILIFRLSDQAVRDALEGPPAELWPEIGIEGQ